MNGMVFNPRCVKQVCWLNVLIGAQQPYVQVRARYSIMGAKKPIPTTQELWQQEYQAFLRQENSQLIFDNLVAITKEMIEIISVAEAV